MTRRGRLTLTACILTFAIGLCALVLALYWQENQETEKEYEALASDAIRLVTPGTAISVPSAAPVETSPAPTPFESGAPSFAPSESPASSPTPKPTATPYAPEEAGGQLEVDFDKLQKANEDLIAWLYLPDTSLSYPIAAANSQRDEGYYLTHSYQGRSSSAGTLFIESWADPKFLDKNTLIHGHRMNSGAMFGNLYQYARQSYYEQHPTMELYTPDGNWRVRIFASFEAELGDFYVQTEFDSDAAFTSYIDQCLQASDIDTGITPKKSDRIVSLVTCVLGDDTARRVVQGVMEKME